MGVDPLRQLGARARIVIEIARGGFIKRRPDGSIDFVSPLPCPYNYGSVPGLDAPDGDPLDALVVGSRLAVGTVVVMPVRDVVRFVDGGVADPKVVCSASPLTPADRRALERFFIVYALWKRGLARVRGQRGATFFAGWVGWTQSD